MTTTRDPGGRAPGTWPWRGLAVLWAVLIGTYASAHRWFYWDGPRHVARVVHLRLWQWQALHFAVWGLLVPAGCAWLLWRLGRVPLARWGVRELGGAIGLLTTITLSLSLIHMFISESEPAVDVPGIESLTEVLLLFVTPGLILLLVVAWVLARRRAGRSPV